MIETPLGIRDQTRHQRIENIYKIKKRYEPVFVYQCIKKWFWSTSQ